MPDALGPPCLSAVVGRKIGFDLGAFMNQLWQHPELGAFTLDTHRDPCWVYRFLERVTRLVNQDNELDCSWVGACSLPAFKVFNYEWEANVPEPVAVHKLTFDGTGGLEPSAGAVEIALRVIANQSKLTSLVTSALWDEFNGRGPKSEMWWYGDLKQVAENLGYDDCPSPSGPDDLLRAMRLTGLTVRESLYEYKEPVAELAFSAGFEPEHGVGILTDGNAILGTGYAGDASPYDQQHHD